MPTDPRNFSGADENTTTDELLDVPRTPTKPQATKQRDLERHILSPNPNSRSYPKLGPKPSLSLLVAETRCLVGVLHDVAVHTWGYI